MYKNPQTYSDFDLTPQLQWLIRVTSGITLKTQYLHLAIQSIFILIIIIIIITIIIILTIITDDLRS
jgi:hypothetical protein